MNYEKFPFGKYKGTPIEKLPLTYIVYALQEFELPIELQDRLKIVLYDYFNMGELFLDFKCEIKIIDIEKTYKEIAKKYHPDMGGSLEAMQGINEFREKLLRL